MSADDDAREAKLRHLLALLKGNQHASNRALRKALGEEAYADFERAWKTQKELREQLKKKPDAIREYEALLKAAIFAYSKADAANTGMNGADKAFEKLYERLEELVQTDRSLTGWFDRDVQWDATSRPTLCPEDAPKVVTSKSLDNRGGGIAAGIRSKREEKIAAIEHKLDELGRSDDSKAAVAARIARALK